MTTLEDTNMEQVKSPIPFEEVKAGSFFRIAELPDRKFQKTRICAVAEDFKMVLFKPDVLCIVEEIDNERSLEPGRK